MKTAMESIKDMVDVNTVVGEAVEAPDGSVIIPVSRVSCGFAAGGSEFQGVDDHGQAQQLPFGGGSGAGMAVQPVAFLVVGNQHVRLLPMDANTTVERLLDLAPELITKAQQFLGRNGGETQGQPQGREGEARP